MHNVFIGLGSNIGDRFSNLKDAIASMPQSGLRPIKTSCVYESLPFKVDTEKLFLNAVVLVETELTPLMTLDVLEEIEHTLGRSAQSKGKCLDRTIDLDILFFDGLNMSDARLTVPHKSIKEREFVLLPLLDINADFIDPVSGRRIADIYQDLKETGSCRKLDVEGWF